MVDEVEDTRGHAQLSKQRHAHEDVAELGNHVESQNLAGGLLAHRAEDADDHRQGEQQDQNPQPAGIAVVDDGVPAVEGVDADLGMQAGKQRRDGRRRVRVGPRQPGVDGHDRGLDEHGEHGDAHRHRRGRVLLRRAIQLAQVHGAVRAVDQADAGQQHRGCQKVRGDKQPHAAQLQVAAAAVNSHRVQPVAGDEHDLDKDEEVEDIGGQQRAEDARHQHQRERHEERFAGVPAGGGKPRTHHGEQSRGGEHERGEHVRGKRDAHQGAPLTQPRRNGRPVLREEDEPNGGGQRRAQNGEQDHVLEPHRLAEDDG